MKAPRLASLLLLCVLAAAPAAHAEDGLTVFDWAGYEAPEFHPGYAEKNGEEPSFAVFGDEDEAFEKLRAGFRADLAHPCSQSVAKWREAGLLEPLDTAKIAAWNDMLPGLMAMKDLATTPDGKAWFMPWEWGNTGLTYNTEKVAEADMASVKALADPKFKDRVSIGDNVDDAYALAALAIGLKDWTAMTEAQFRQASDFLRAVHQNVRLYWADTTEIVQAMSGGEVDLAWAWNDAATQLAAEGMPVRQKRDTAEGTSTWVCGYVRLKGAPGSADKAYDFLNAINQPRAASYLITDWGYAHSTRAGLASVPPEVLREKGYGDLDTFMDKTLFQSPLPNALKARMIAEFEKIKAGY